MPAPWDCFQVMHTKHIVQGSAPSGCSTCSFLAPKFDAAVRNSHWNQRMKKWFINNLPRENTLHGKLQGH